MRFDRLDTSAQAGSGGPPISYSGALGCCRFRPWRRLPGPGDLPLAHVAPAGRCPSRSRPHRRRPGLRRGGRAPPPRRAAAARGRRVGRDLRGAVRRRRLDRRHAGAAPADPPRVAAGARRAAAGERRPPGGDLGRAGPGPRALGRHHRRRPAGPARGHRRDAGRRARPGRRRRLRRAGGPHDRHRLQAAECPGVLPLDPRALRGRRPRRRGRLPPHVEGHGGCRQRPAGAQPGAAPRRAGPRVPQRVGRLRACRHAPRDARSTRWAR